MWEPVENALDPSLGNLAVMNSQQKIHPHNFGGDLLRPNKNLSIPKVNNSLMPLAASLAMCWMIATMTEHIFLTGSPGVGKTTAVMKVVDKVRQNLPECHIRGFYTKECRSEGQRVGFDLVSLSEDGQILPLATVGSSPPTVGRFSVLVDNVAKLAVPSMQPFQSPDPALFALDELGKMELLCPDFYPAAKALLDSAQTRSSFVLGTLPLPRRPIPEVDEVSCRPDTTILLVSKSNRNSLAEALAELVCDRLGKPQESQTPIREYMSDYIFTTSTANQT
eukprot:CAMPEP_0116827314 /NCGR_PEP_ID=MMETSP0418-20121206/3028_1 /TAXON_ID=1158023 /ORGANISM="Astrosyne radiata, Strain 13vi08-1A" /LENGTH=278 /DNA_ID=CAMNT_0004456071 /DNA_START=216 /DNA_END=1052 /DNA_ORIENTATION=-